MTTKNIAIVIPSYNESLNLKILINSILKNLRGSTIIIVDDSSVIDNQKIKIIIENIANNKIKLFSRQKKLGRGSAVIEGFIEALKDKKLKYFFEMDSDLSHKPEECYLFLEKIKKENCDLVIGSRYLKDSNVTNWSKKRIVSSKIINKMLNLILGINISDYTNGFRLYNRQAVKYLTKIEIKSKGFIVLSETAFKLKQKGFKISEVPTTFLERKYGQSSVGPGEFINALTGVLKIRLSN